MTVAVVGAFALCARHSAMAGEDASGPIRYAVDLSRPFTSYAMSAADKEWSRSLVRNLKYSGSVTHFARTTLPLMVNDSEVEGAVYRAIERPQFFYVVNGDAMLELNLPWAYHPGVGGFSMHAPRSRNFIVALNMAGGVPFLTSSPVRLGKVNWKGHDYDRFRERYAEPAMVRPDAR